MTYYVIFTGEIPHFGSGWYLTYEEALAVCDALFKHYKNKKVPASRANWRVVKLTEKDPMFKAYGGTLAHCAASAFNVNMSKSPIAMLLLTKKGLKVIHVD